MRRWATHRTVAAVTPWLCLSPLLAGAGAPHFQTSDRCVACHTGVSFPSAEDLPIAADWRTSLMANSSRDPYWQASVRRETLDHAGSRSEIEDECSVCHMPIARYQARLAGRPGQVFIHLPFKGGNSGDREAADGVSCSVCHQITPENLGKPDSFNGGFQVKGLTPQARTSNMARSRSTRGCGKSCAPPPVASNRNRAIRSGPPSCARPVTR